MLSLKKDHSIREKGEGVHASQVVEQDVVEIVQHVMGRA